MAARHPLADMIKLEVIRDVMNYHGLMKLKYAMLKDMNISRVFNTPCDQSDFNLGHEDHDPPVEAMSHFLNVTQRVLAHRTELKAKLLIDAAEDEIQIIRLRAIEGGLRIHIERDQLKTLLERRNQEINRLTAELLRTKNAANLRDGDRPIAEHSVQMSGQPDDPSTPESPASASSMASPVGSTDTDQRESPPPPNGALIPATAASIKALAGKPGRC